MGIYSSGHCPMLSSNCCYNVFVVMVNKLSLRLTGVAQAINNLLRKNKTERQLIKGISDDR